MSANPFGRYVRDERVKAGLSLRVVAAMLGMTPVYLGAVERGVEKPFRGKYWEALAQAIPGITVEELERRSRMSRRLEIDIMGQPEHVGEAVTAFARRVETNSLSSKLAERIKAILEEED